MRQLKVLGLVLIAMAALTAAVGAGTASATLTSLCKEEALVCPEAQEYEEGTLIESSLEAGTKLFVEGGIKQVQCGKSGFDFVTTEQTEIPLHTTIVELTFEECGTCAAKLAKGGEIDIEVIDLPVPTFDGTMTMTKAQIETECAMIPCTYEPADMGVLKGGKNTISVSGSMKRVAGGFICPTPVKIKGSYTIKSPEPIWVSE